MSTTQCKICRRSGEKLFLKSDKCMSPRCPMIKKAYAPGQKGKRRKRISEYGRELTEKQKLRNWYNLSEKQFHAHVKDVLSKRSKTENTANLLIGKLETRLDNAVFRLGFAGSRRQARQLVSHGHFLINNRKVNIPSFALKNGQTIAPSSKLRQKPYFKNRLPILKKHTAPSWFLFDKKKLSAQVRGKPNLEEVAPPVEVSAIFEYYSR